MIKALLIGTLLVAGHAFSQEVWQTIHTEHFNVHFSTENQQWAQSAATELEIVRNKVLKQQNRALDEVIDVVVFDPFNASNGFALPVTIKPLMALFTTPPQSDSMIANTDSWQQLLILHEYIHLVHLAQPTRSLPRQAIRNIWDLYDLSQSDMPRWVAEGYATLLESKMTGRGRLYDNLSEAILVEFAQQGALPSYGQLNRTEDSYMAGSMAYLMGARFLAWLEDNYSPNTLDAVWTRMQAVKSRDFNDAFSGVFGDSPERLYRRFIAEYTYKAMAKEVSEQTLTSELWLELDLYASNPVLSLDNSKLAIVERNKDDETRLVIYSTADNQQAADDFAKQQQQLLDDDPADIADRAPSVFKRKQKHVLHQINKQGIKNPQWLDEDTLFFTATTTVGKGSIQGISDLYRYDIETGEISALTHHAGLRRFTISDNGQTVYAEQTRHGFSELVRFDLNTGVSTPLFKKSLETVYDYPLLSPNKTKLAYLKVALNANWQLYIQDMNSQQSIAVPMPEGYQYVSQPNWQADGKGLYFVAGKNAALDLYHYDLSRNSLRQLTQGQEAVAYPMAMNNGELLYLSITAEGPDIKHFAEQPQGLEVAELASNTAPPRGQVTSEVLPEAKIYKQSPTEPANYDIWQQKPTFSLASQYYSASSSLLTIGLKSNDFLKQLDLQAGYSVDLHDKALEGVFAAAKYSAFDLKFKALLFDYDLESAKQYHSNTPLNVSNTGAHFAMSYPMQFQQLNITPTLSYNYSDYAKGDDQWLKLGLKQQWQHDRQRYGLSQSLRAEWLSGDADSNNWQGYNFATVLSGYAFDIPVYVNFAQQYRDDSTLALGGYESNLINKDTQSGFVSAPELPFFSQLGNRYKGYGGGISYKDSLPWLYYQQHQVDNRVYAQSYGLKWRGDFSFGLGPAGLNDVNIDFGVARVESDDFENDLRAWLSFYYSL
ncbi:TolB family protein [Pseudoalteromonas sp. 68 DY56-GL68]|uniref:TolB family protein n=1 Tax=Pseudoalteromonas sp. 68 DY56-GL68 TaxID=2974919 RepID=UPI00352B3A23